MIVADHGRDERPAGDLAEAAARDRGPVAEPCIAAVEDHVGAGREPDAEVGADQGEQVKADDDERRPGG